MIRFLLFLFLSTATAFAQTVNVTILLNTATVPDTIRSTAFVQMRGDKAPLTSDSASPVIFTRVAGDYWKAIVPFAVHDTVRYSFFVNGNRNRYSGLDAPPLRTLIVGTSDTTLPLQYAFGSVKDTNQYWRPFIETDSIEILFRVNMELQEDFRDEQRIAAVRGSFPSSNWGTSVFLTKEKPHALPESRGYDAGNFWSGVVRVPRPLVPTRMEYKFVQHFNSDSPAANPLQWEDAIRTTCGDNDVDGNRFFILRPGHSDTTLAFKYWRNNECPLSLLRDTVIISFTTELSNAIKNNNYVVGDSVLVVTGFRNTNTTLHSTLMKKMGLTFYYTAIDTIIFANGFRPQNLVYRYVQRINGSDINDKYWDYTTMNPSIRSDRIMKMIYNGSKQQYSVHDTSRSVYMNNRVPYFLKNRRIVQNVSVTLVCDLRPPYRQLAGVNDTVFSFGSPFVITNKDSVYKYGVWVNGIGFDSRGWLPWGDTLFADPSRRLYDDGTHGDVTANDHRYSRTFMIYKDSVAFNSILKEYKYGIRGYDNETGKGFSVHRFTTIDDNNSMTTVSDEFGDQTPFILTAWGYQNSKLNEEWTAIPKSDNPSSFNIQQNFPNPFNPGTSITFSLPQGIASSARTTLTIYDLLGRTKATLVDGILPAGDHSVQWNAQGQPSGVYIYRLTSGAHSISRRMLLLK